MTEASFIECMKSIGYITEEQQPLTWEQVEKECALIDSKKSCLSSSLRKVFSMLRYMKDNKLELPTIIEKEKGDTPNEERGPVNVQL